ncbi:MAG TPA: thioredoxin domain-containing protein, partial [Pyrinomonadaceae bacterium]
MSRNPKQSKSSLPFVIIGGVLVAVIAAVVLMSRPGGGNTPPAQQSGNSTASPVQQTRAPQAGAPNPWAKGGAGAKVTLEEFSDFQCPACGGLEPALRNVVKDYGDNVRLVFRNFPLAMHKYAFQAARAAEAAGQQGKFWE